VENKLKFNHLSFKQVKELVDTISLSEKNRVFEVSGLLKSDLRKNVQMLGRKLEKNFTSYTEELSRVEQLYNFDKSFENYNLIAGIDEVGRGPLAGPIVCGAVIFDLKKISDENMILQINDSKKFRIRRKTPERVLPIQNSEGYYYPREYDELVLPAGGIFSTAGDLLLLGKALLNNGMSDGCKLLSPYTLKEMTTPQTTGIPYWNAGPNMRGVEVGLGWFLPVNRHSIIKRNIYGHNGAGDCMFWVYPDEGLTFAFMTNYDFARDPQGADIDMIHNVFSSCLGG
jgi:hypothetical protein